MLILDASGSMWGQIKGRAKISMAREAVADVLGRLPSDQKIGLMAYGHRRKGECADIEVLVSPAPGTSAQISSAVSNLRPLGKTPISDALLLAADAVGWREEPATVVLVSDGLETCDRDPCAIATALEKSGIDFVAHVVGLGLTREENAALSCIADNTGGLFLTADDTTGLADALNTTIAATAGQAEVAKAPEPAAAPQVILRALYAPGGPTAVQGVIWTVTPPAAAQRSYDSSRPQLDLPPGTFAYEVRHGAVLVGGSADMPMGLEPGEVRFIDVVLNAGGIFPYAVREADGEPINELIQWKLTPRAKPSGLAPEARLSASEAQPEFFLPAGDYELTASFSGISVSQSITLAPGEMLRPELVLASGRLAATARLPGENDYLRSGVSWAVLKAAADGSLSRVTSTLSPRTAIDLPPGEYVARFSKSPYQLDTPFRIEADVVSELELELDAGLVITQIGRGLPSWSVLQASDGSVVGRDAGARADFLLAPGAYVIRADVDGDVQEKEISVSAGDRLTLSF